MTVTMPVPVPLLLRKVPLFTNTSKPVPNHWLKSKSPCISHNPRLTTPPKLPPLLFRILNVPPVHSTDPELVINPSAYFWPAVNRLTMPLLSTVSEPPVFKLPALQFSNALEEIVTEPARPPLLRLSTPLTRFEPIRFAPSRSNRTISPFV